MGSDLTVGHTEFTPYDSNFNTAAYLETLKEKMSKSAADEVMADITLIYDRFGSIRGVFVNDMDLSQYCSDVEIKTVGLEAVLHINMKKLKVINKNE